MEKLKTIKATIKDNDRLFKSEHIAMDNDRSDVCIVVNKLESDDEDKLHAASSSDSDSEGEEE